MDLFARLKVACADEWDAYVTHPFVSGLGDGSLPEASFRHYLIQDYLFLIQFARAYAVAAYKSTNLQDMRFGSNNALLAIVDTELELHIRLSKQWGLDASQLENAMEARATLAYTRFVLDTGMRGDLLDLFVALAPCTLGYGEIGTRLAAYPGALENSNPYHEWVEEYSGKTYQDSAQETRFRLNCLAQERLTETRFEDISAIFRAATRLEADFWEMGMTLSL